MKRIVGWDLDAAVGSAPPWDGVGMPLMLN